MTTFQPDNQQPGNSPQLPAQAIAALSRGRKIEAIKIVHQQMGLGLKDSKELIEAYAQQHPQSTATPVGITASKSRYSMTVGILVLLLVALMLALMFF